MSAQIRQESAAYYDILERTQKAAMDVTPWMNWFLACLGHAPSKAPSDSWKRARQSSLLGVD